ncbi:YhfX family PLP-dependent enzyme [Thermoanaerobacterium sp. DL9XJH110]|uniref:YhfX family PLP-dependent enzyme n=1 Tax=Thermoanaerobacterium sp. DL9XJH110 TaxID=3386643 RepID=UPI003BB6CB3D
MFLEVTLKNNPALIDAAAKLHREGLIEPNTYCIDLDMVRKNAELLSNTAQKYRVNLYFMTKQFGRNPVVSRAIMDSGIEKAVAVDLDEARLLYKNGIKIGHIGHLVQVPRSGIKEALGMNPDFITCFSTDKARQINDAAKELGLVQNILLRVVDDGDYIYPGQEGGIKLRDLERAALEIKKLDNIKIKGVTSFPCFLYNYKSGGIEPTKNLFTIKKAADILKGLGFDISQINGPSATCTSSIPLLKEMGVTSGEPGHALTGTTPLHAGGTEPEVQAMVYVTEVSHTAKGKAYVFGGGFYSRSRMKKAYIPGKNLVLNVKGISPESIDYYAAVLDGGNELEVGDTVIFSFRTQVFVTRSKVAVVEGIQEGNPRLVGIFNHLGDEIK